MKTQHEGKVAQTGNQSLLADIFFGVASAIFGFDLAAKKLSRVFYVKISSNK